jgi:hypothetical protein
MDWKMAEKYIDFAQARDLSVHQNIHTGWEITNLLFSGYQELFIAGKSSWNM